MKKILTLAMMAAFAMVSSASAGIVLLNETFDSSAGFTTSTPFFSDGGGDFFGISGSAADFGGGATPGVPAFTGFNDNFLTGEDLDGEGATLPITVTWSSINIAGQTGLTFSGDFAEFFNAPGDIDPTDLLFVEAQIDGGGFAPILQFTPGSFSSTVNGVFELGTATLGDAAQNFSASIPGTGSTLDLRLTVSVNAGDEDFAVDNFLVTADSAAVPEPSSIALLGLVGLAGVVRRRK